MLYLLIGVFGTGDHWLPFRVNEKETYSITTTSKNSILSYHYWLWLPKSLFSSWLHSKFQKVYGTHNRTQSRKRL